MHMCTYMKVQCLKLVKRALLIHVHVHHTIFKLAKHFARKVSPLCKHYSVMILLNVQAYTTQLYENLPNFI